VFILVTDYGFEQVPFLPNDRNAIDGLVLDEDAVRVDIQKWMDEPVVYSVYGGTWNRNHHDEYIIYLYDKVWELISEEEGRHRGKIRYKAINKFLDEVIWIAETDSPDLESYIRGYDCGSYELRIFGKRLIWDATTIGENGDPRYIKLDKSLKKLLKAFEPEEDD
jgi:hypothetical protein